MFDRKSDYALNKKDQEAIVCKSVTDIHIRLTRYDFSSLEEFEAWKSGLTRTTTKLNGRITSITTMSLLWTPWPGSCLLPSPRRRK